MAWSFVGVGNSTTVASGNITLVEPSGTAEGDLLVACIAYRSTATFTVPSDWNLVATQQSSGNTSTTASTAIASGLMMWTVRGASAPTLTITRTAGDVAMASVVGYRGQRGSNPYDTGSSNTIGASSNTATTGTITTAEDGELIVAFRAGADNGTTSAFDAATDPTTASGATDTSTAPTNGTWIERRDANSTSGADTAIAIADAIRATAGATGTIQSTSSTVGRHVMAAAAFLPAINVSLTGETLTASPTLTDGSSTGTAEVAGETLTATPVLIDGYVGIDTADDELIREDGGLVLREDGGTIILEASAAGGDVNVTGETLTVTLALVDGTATGTASVTGETLTATPTLIDGSVSVSVTVTGETLTATPTLTDGTATGTASVTGETLTATPTLVDGTVSASASVTGETLTATPALTDGTATGTASVTGETLTATPTLVDGTATGTANVTGETLSVSLTLLGGTATGNADVTGETLTVTPVLLDGSVTAGGSVTVAGETLTVAVELVDGSVTADANVDGETLTASATLIDGTVTTEGSVTVDGEILVATPVLVAGTVTTVSAPVEDDYDSHWHYAREQKKRRARLKALRTPKVFAAAATLGDVVSVVAVAVLAAPASDVQNRLDDAAGVAVFSIADYSVDCACETDSVTADASFRVVNILDELRDLEDMVDLYEILLAA